MSADRDHPNRFAEGFLHEARNAVFGLSVTLDALEEDADPGSALVDQGRTLAALSDRTARLMHDLVAWVEAPPFVREKLPLQDVLNEAVASARERLGTRVIEIEGEATFDRGATVSVDRACVARSLCSVIQGVAIAVPSAKPLALTITRPHAGRLEISIVGRGADVSAERIITFFEPFAIRGARITGFAVALARRCFDSHGIGVRIGRTADDGLSLSLGFDLV